MNQLRKVMPAKVWVGSWSSLQGQKSVLVHQYKERREHPNPARGLRHFAFCGRQIHDAVPLRIIDLDTVTFCTGCFPIETTVTRYRLKRRFRPRPRRSWWFVWGSA